MFELGCTYGCRVNEPKELRVRHVDIGARTIRLDPGTTKNGMGRVVTFESGSLICRLLSECVYRKSPNDFVFTRSGGRGIRDFRGTWAKACCAAGVGRVECKTCS